MTRPETRTRASMKGGPVGDRDDALVVAVPINTKPQ